ncbi:Thaumatin family protein [Streptomyces sp. DvalAA-14]|uniref:thaumatin family protein n=1 Tax=Streptomyces sp. SID4948 TaxID=2690287 RepID=UPI00081B1A29|nr:Thaumatin pathogenesis-related protein [Streptomyces sp. SID4948]SCE26613.1 Thaumatin family protein [Streptomyces sp. DvalAA-14]
MAVGLFACLAVVAAVFLAGAQGDGGAGSRAAVADPGTSASTATSGTATATVAVPSPSPSKTPARPTPSRTPASATSRPARSAPARKGGAAVPTGRAAGGSTKGSTLHPGPGERTLTLVNRLNQTIWPAIAADPAHPVAATGWVLAPGASLSFLIPDHWDVRVWARTGCVFNAAGTGHCVTGDCAGHFQCGRTWGEFPSTLAEFNLNAWNGMDFYDVSLVEGNNLPMWINNSGGSSPDKIDANGCSAAGCTHDANASCPKVMQRVRGGAVVACLSACLVYGTDQTCCTGAYASRPACVPSTWPTDSAAVFKKAEPFAYSYVNDDATSVLTCSGECDYRITWGVSP